MIWIMKSGQGLRVCLFCGVEFLHLRHGMDRDQVRGGKLGQADSKQVDGQH